MTKILVIEDNNLIVRTVKAMLTNEGYEVIVAENGKIGFELIKSCLPDLILCDIFMPEMDGYQVLEEMRKDNSISSIPFIFLTGKNSNDEFRMGMELGADDYLAKPFTTEALINSIKIRLEKYYLLMDKSEEKLKFITEGLSYKVPHEFITPLSIIKNCTEILIDHSKEPLSIDIANKINRASERLENLINNFVLYSKIDILLTNPEKLKIIQTENTNNPVDLINKICSEKAEKLLRNNELVINIQDNFPVLVSNKNLEKIVDEIIDNAFKFSAKGSQVILNVFREDDYLCIQIIDHGRGITDEQIANIDAYVQFDREKYEQQGMGLGLIIAKKLTEIHQGIFSIKSQDNQTIVDIKLKVINSD